MRSTSNPSATKSPDDRFKPIDNFIDAAFSHLFELSEDEKKLTQEIKNISDAFNDKPLEEKNDYRFIQNPTQHLSRLEHCTKEAFKVGEVRSRLLKYAHEHIVKAVEKANFKLDDKLWNREALQAKINSKSDFNTVFKSVQPKQNNNTYLYPVPSNQQQIFNAWIETDERYEYAIVKIQIKLEDHLIITHTINQYRLLPRFVNDDEQRNFFIKTANEALAQVINETFLFVITQLHLERIITYSEYKLSNPYGNLLLTYQPYIDLLKNKKISYSILTKLDEKQAKTLSHTTISQLIIEKYSDIDHLKDASPELIDTLSNQVFYEWVTKNTFNVDTLISLNQDQKNVASYHTYKILIEQNKIDINIIKKLTTSECKNLLLPSSMHFISSGLMTFDQARTMSSGTRTIISSQNYYDAIKNGKLKYSDIEGIQEEDVKLLLDNDISQLVINHNINWKQCLLIRPHAAKLFLADALIRHLIEKKLLDFVQLSCITQDTGSLRCMQPTKIQPIDKKQEYLFRALLIDFVSLSLHKLLTDLDLHYLFDNYDLFFSKSKEALISLEKNDNLLLKFKMFQDRCQTNIRQRLHGMFEKAVNECKSEDTYEQLISDCKKHSIDATQIARQEFIDIIKTNLLSYNLKTIKNINNIGHTLQLSSTDIHGSIFTQRLIAIYANKPYHLEKKADSIDLIINDLLQTAISYNIPHEKLQLIALSAVASRIKQDIQEAFSKLSSPPEFYKQIYNLIDDAEKQSSKLNEQKDQLSIWQTTIEQTKKCITEKMRELGSVKASPSITFFLPKQTLNTETGTLNFCNNLVTISKIVSIQSVSRFSFGSLSRYPTS